MTKAFSFLFFICSFPLFSTPRQDLLRQLQELHYWEIYQTNIDRHSALWQNGENLQGLLWIISTNKSSAPQKFLAAEIIWNGGGSIPEEYYPLLAKTYAQALSASDMNRNEYGDYQLSGNHWGFLYYEAMHHHGMLGDHILLLDRYMLAPLLSLMDEKGSIFYEGSQEATLGNSLDYRVCDVAAYYLSEISGIPLQYNREDNQQSVRREEFRMKLLKELSDFSHMTIESYKSIISPVARKSVTLTDSEKIEESFRYLENIPLQGDHPWHLPPSVRLIDIVYYMDEYPVKRVRVYNDKVQAADRNFFYDIHREEVSAYLLYIKGLLES